LVHKMIADNDPALKGAQKMIDRYGDGVLKEVDIRIAELQEQGQTETHDLWVKIRKAVLCLIDTSNNKTMH